MNMNNITLGAITLQGDNKCFVGGVSVKKESYLTPMPLYGSDSTDTIIFDFGGVNKTLNVSGIYIGTNIADCASFIALVEGRVNGKQDSSSGFPIDYVDDYRGTIKVKVGDCQTDVVMGEPLIVRWEFTLLQSSTDG